MPISLNWDNENRTVLRLIFWNEWTLEEYVAQFEIVIDALKTITHSVDILIDLRTDSYVPRGDSLRAFRNVMDKLPQNTGTIVYVNDNPVQRHLFDKQLSFYNTVSRGRKQRVYMVETLEEAYELINKHQARRD